MSSSDLSNIASIQEHICNESFGLHHMIRELGQIYEALEVSQSNDSSLSHLPKAAAKLLIDGFPLEIMDGSAAHASYDKRTRSDL